MSSTEDLTQALEGLVSEGLIIKGEMLPREPRKRATFAIHPNDSLYLEYNGPQVDAFIQGIRAAQAAATVLNTTTSLEEVSSAEPARTDDTA